MAITEQFKNLPPWGQALVSVGLAAGLVVFAHMVFPGLNDMKQSNERKTMRLDDLQQEIKTGRLVEQNLPRIEKEINTLTMKLSDLRQILPTEPETGDLLAWIKNLADQSNLVLKKFAPGRLKLVADTYKEFPINMDIVGAYHDLGIFFDRISKYSRIININNVVIKRNSKKGDKTIGSTFNATTFIYYDKDQDKDAGSQKKGKS
ncbi:MAG: type 4a pilus biogenesis protein PilO [Acidobacteriota bacterium]|nr:type 4a pilus biogenesis protein PilO [Acidobacteriota bacterium]